MTILRRALPRFLVFAMMGLVLGPALPVMAQQPTVFIWKTMRTAPLYGAPSGQSPLIGSIPKDANLTALRSCANGWCAVEYNGVRGWIPQGLPSARQAKPRSAAVAPPHPLSRPALLPKTSLKTFTAPKPLIPRSKPLQKATIGGVYRVFGLAAGDILPIREGPIETAAVIGTLSASSTEITGLEPCKNQWCLIAHEGVKGYVQSRFLGAEAELPRKYTVNGPADLNVLSFRDNGAERVGVIPYYADGIVPIGPCDTQWCHIRYLGLVGFVDARRLRTDASPPRG